MKQLIKITAFTIVIFLLGFWMGFISAKSRIINNALENKKDCNDLEDMRIIINK